jgi:hypothetical protein
MKKEKKRIFAVICTMVILPVLLSGCILQGSPTLHIIAPTDGATLISTNVTINVAVGNFSLVNKIGQTNQNGQGHLNYFLDLPPPTNQDQPALTTPGTYVTTSATHHTWENISPGQHYFSVELVNNNNTPLNPPVYDYVQITVTSGQKKTPTYKLNQAWYNTTPIYYYSFGQNTTLTSNGILQTAPIYIFIHNSTSNQTPVEVQGQHDIINILPGEVNYSDLRQVYYVTVPSDYTPDSIRSFTGIQQHNYPIQSTNIFLNCPIVRAGSTFETNITLNQGWCNGQPIYYPNFGSNPDSPSDVYIPASLLDIQGQPQKIPGQYNIMNSTSGQQNYSAFLQITYVLVPLNYSANTLRSVAEIHASPFLQNHTKIILNCPLINSTKVAGH